MRGRGKKDKREKSSSHDPATGVSKLEEYTEVNLYPREPTSAFSLSCPALICCCFTLLFFLAHRKDGVFLEARRSFLIPVCRFPHGAPYTSSSDKTQTARPTDPCRCL